MTDETHRDESPVLPTEADYQDLLFALSQIAQQELSSDLKKIVDLGVQALDLGNAQNSSGDDIHLFKSDEP